MTCQHCSAPATRQYFVNGMLVAQTCATHSREKDPDGDWRIPTGREK